MASAPAVAEAARSRLPVELAVNGRRVTARPGQTILDVVREHGLDEIPTLCHDPRLEPYGSCFLCVVEVKGAPRLVPACVTRVRDGMEVTTRSERIERARRAALELLLSDHFADCICPAKSSCPAGVDIQGYLGLVRLQRYEEALALIMRRNPLPVVCGRVCVRKCEIGCRRSHVDEPVAINSVKRFVTERASAATVACSDGSGRRVAVVGGGPAGLACSYYLALDGHSVTIFESMPKLGGMLRYGIPSYRLPRTELDGEIEAILDVGVRAETGKRLGRDFTIASLLGESGFAAVFLATGAPVGKRIGVKGETDAAGLQTALDFLRDVETAGPPVLRGRTIVVGGGNSAIDAARTALRCGAAEAVILYRRTRAEMPAHPEEVRAAEEEGVRIELLVAPLEVLSRDGRVCGIRCQRMQLGEPDSSGRRRPVPVEGSQADYDCEFLVSAIGQETDLGTLRREPGHLRPGIGSGSLIEVNPATMSTRADAVFAGGDVVLGPSAVIDAIAHGRTAARAISAFLGTDSVGGNGREFFSRLESFGPLPEELFRDVERRRRTPMPAREPRERVRDFGEVELGLDDSQAGAEVARCMECGCKSVFECDLRRYATEYGVEITRSSGEVRRPRVDRSHPLITLDGNKCILCGLCVRVCADIVGLSVLGFVGRGFGTVVRPAAGKPLAESSCVACGACVEICPTGALEARLPCVPQGPWRSRTVRSACGFCSLACRLDLHAVSEGVLWATAPADQGSGYGELCMKGRFGTGIIHGLDRLRTPLVRKDGRLVAAEWEEAFVCAAGLLRNQIDRSGRESVAVLAAPRMTLEEAFLVRQLAVQGIGTAEVGSYGQYRRGGPRRDLDGFMGETASTCLLENIDEADMIFIAGADPAATHPVLAMAVRRAAKRGATLVAAGSSRLDLLRPRDLWLDARRGTAGIVYAALLLRVLEDGRRMVQAGREKLVSSLAWANVDAAAELTGVSRNGIDACAELVRRARRMVIVYDLDDTLERSKGDLAALAAIASAKNGAGQDGSHGLLLLRTDCNGEGARLAGISNPVHIERIRGAVVIFENPLGDFRSASDFRRFESLVVVDHFMTETARAADVVLPGATLAETDGTVVSSDGRLVAVRRACRPPGGLSTGEVVAGLCRTLGTPCDDAGLPGLRSRLAASIGVEPRDVESARENGRPLARPKVCRLPEALHFDSEPSVANCFPYATLDATLKSRLRQIGLISEP